MNNSFYYFFSATPQVLGGILALFGVFVVFKIQNIKDNIIGVGQSLLDRLSRLSTKQSESFDLPEGFTFRQYTRTLENAITRKDIKNLKVKIDLIKNVNYRYYVRNMNKLEDFLNDIISRTIFWSKITAIVIVVCISAIPFGDFILVHLYILSSIFSIVIISIIFIFYHITSILKDSLKDPELE